MRALLYYRGWFLWTREVEQDSICVSERDRFGSKSLRMQFLYPCRGKRVLMRGGTPEPPLARSALQLMVGVSLSPHQLGGHPPRTQVSSPPKALGCDGYRNI